MAHHLDEDRLAAQRFERCGHIDVRALFVGLAEAADVAGFL